MNFERIRDALLLRNLVDRDRRAVLLGVAVLLPALLWITIGRPYRAALSDLRERVAAERGLLEREEALVARAETLPQLAAELEDRARSASLKLVNAANVPLAEAELTAFLEETASLSRVLLQEIRTIDLERERREPPDTLGLRPLRLSVRGESDLEGVLTYLHRLENSPLLLNVVELSIAPVVAGARRNEERTVTGVVQFTLILEGYAPGAIAPPADEEVSS